MPVVVRMLFRAQGWVAATLLFAASLLLAIPRAALGQSEPRPEAADGRVAEARRHFELGVAHFDRKEWEAALAEFLRSRELAPARANTKNAAICLRKVGRFDEALSLFESLLRDFPELPPADRELAQREISELSASVGTLEISDAPAGASVIVDGIERGLTPLARPIRLAAGSHGVRVVKDGSLPFEARVDLAGREAKVLRVRLAALTHAGRLRVSERDGRRVDVLVDGARVGSAPWDGALAPGVHSVALRGTGTLGTPPTRVVVVVERSTSLELVAVPLAAELSVRATPDAAQIFVDGAFAARGHWRGRLRDGSHRIDVTLAGYAPFSRAVTLPPGEQRFFPVTLESLVQEARIALELDGGMPLVLIWGGDLLSGCVPPCSATLPIGVYAQAHASYVFSTGVGLGVHAGYLRAWNTLTQRQESVSVTNREPHRGTADDHLRIAGLMAGAEADYAIGTTWPVSFRLSAGALIGAATDERTAVLIDSAPSRYTVTARQYPRASYLYLGPEARLGYRVGSFEASVGTKLFLFAALTRPAWDGDTLVYAGETDRGGYFQNAQLTGAVMMALMPGLAVRYAF